MGVGLRLVVEIEGEDVHSGESLSGRAGIINTGSEPVHMRTLRTVFGGVALPGGDRLLGQFRGWQTTARHGELRTVGPQLKLIDS